MDRAPGSRAGMTVSELLIGSALSFIVAGAVAVLASGGHRMNRAAQVSVSLHNALIMQESISQDVRQLGLDPARPDIMLMSDRSLSFYRVVFEGPTIRLRPVKYTVTATRSGNFRVCRLQTLPGGSERHEFAAILKDIRFAVGRDRIYGGRYLRVVMEVLDDDRAAGSTPPAGAARSVRLTLTAQISVPSQLGDPALAPSARLVPEARLMPVDP